MDFYIYFFFSYSVNSNEIYNKNIILSNIDVFLSFQVDCNVCKYDSVNKEMQRYDKYTPVNDREGKYFYEMLVIFCHFNFKKHNRYN